MGIIRDIKSGDSSVINQDIFHEEAIKRNFIKDDRTKSARQIFVVESRKKNKGLVYASNTIDSLTNWMVMLLVVITIAVVLWW